MSAIVSINDPVNLGLSIREKIETASIKERCSMIDTLYSKWVIDINEFKKILKREPNIHDFINVTLENFGLEMNGLQLGLFEKANLISMNELAYLRLYLEQTDLSEIEMYNIDKTEYILKLNKIFKSFVDAGNTIRYAIHLQDSLIQNEIGSGEQLDITRYTPPDMSNNTAYQNLLLFLIENLFKKGYRRYNGECYKKIFTEKGFDTHTWKSAMTLKEFIYDNVRREIHYEMWQNLTNSKDNAYASVKYLTDFKGGEFEDITKDRHIFSFNNGIYFAKRKNEDDGLYYDEWVAYEGPDYRKIGSSVVACNYFDIDFDEETRPKSGKYRYNDWFKIIEDKCPNFKSIMDYQEWEEDVQKWLCIFIGRNIYEVGELDGWQVLVYLLGQAGSGKSTIINYILKRIYEKCDIGVISNNIETKFGLSAIHDKLMFIAPEIKANFKLEQSEFQSIISGEAVSVATKNEIAKTVEWKVPGMMAGNEIPQYSDNAGSISRRIIAFMFNKRVKKGDTQLGHKLEKEMPQIIHACNRAYIEAINKHGSKDIWSVLPQYFLDSRDEMAETTNALTAFLRSDKVLITDDTEKFVPEALFIDVYNIFCRDMNIPKQRWNHQYCLGPFSNFNITVSKYAKLYEPDGTCKRMTGTFYFGLELLLHNKNQDDDEPQQLTPQQQQYQQQLMYQQQARQQAQGQTKAPVQSSKDTINFIE
jgi:hypothetical protein